MHHIAMAAFTFSIRRVNIPGTHTHSWEAVDDANSKTIPLPKGGNGEYLGRYPEIEEYLKKCCCNANLTYSRRRGDTLDLDDKNGVYTWIFNTCGAIVVEDIPRVVGEFTAQSMQ